MKMNQELDFMYVKVSTFVFVFMSSFDIVEGRPMVIVR